MRLNSQKCSPLFEITKQFFQNDIDKIKKNENKLMDTGSPTSLISNETAEAIKIHILAKMLSKDLELNTKPANFIV